MPGAARLGGEQPDHAPGGEGGQPVDESVDEVTVVVAPPQQDDVDDVLVVLVHERGTGDLLDGDPEVFVAVLVPAELLHHLAGLQRQAARPLAALRGVRGRTHETVPSGHVPG